MRKEIMLGSPLEQFEIVPMVGVLGITNASLMLWLSVIGVVVLCKVVSGGENGRVVPTRWQVMLESVYGMVVGMVEGSIGKGGSKYVPLVLTQVMLVGMLNGIGLVPYSYTVTAQLVVTMCMALGIWIGKLIVGVKKHGVGLLGILLPEGVPLAMAPMMIMIELLSFVIPVVSLSVRLFANLMSGHILLKVLFGFTWSMMMAGGIGFIGHILPLGILFCLMGLETAVAGIQAYVFGLLMCIYIGDMEEGGH